MEQGEIGAEFMTCAVKFRNCPSEIIQKQTVKNASFAGLCIIATSITGVIKFNQLPNFYTLIGLTLIVSGVLLVNILGQN